MLFVNELSINKNWEANVFHQQLSRLLGRHHRGGRANGVNAVVALCPQEEQLCVWFSKKRSCWDSGRLVPMKRPLIVPARKWLREKEHNNNKAEVGSPAI